ncbi:hypothetical protein [Thalassoroseus pseudoceratinae]|uniref:hypothetical protein n=1 Tax=Thalassoroseus pseudoceratinae TaxID=2713176 RepID=UPI001423CE55|nr:hypothetical protein [Thalassoroseus pseudoceratinae]
MRQFQSCMTLLGVCLLFQAAVCAETVTLKESASSDAVWQVASDVHVRGVLKTPQKGGELRAMPLKVDATFRYRERRLPGAGRDAQTLRSLREYETASAAIEVDRDKSSSKLRDTNKLVVAHGRREGIQFYRPTGTMSVNELELLHTPGDSLAILGLLPPKPVEVGESWTPETWVPQMLTSTEALLKADLTCRLESAENDRAEISFQGEVEAALEGATTKLRLTGNLTFDLRQNYIRHVELTQTEQRTVGPVSPGMDVTASMTVDRSPAARNGRLTRRQADATPLEPTAEMLALQLQLANGTTVSHNRDWRVFHQSGRNAILRWVDEGSLIAQANLTTLPNAAPGNHLQAAQFEANIKKGLADADRIVSSKRVADANRFIHRIDVTGRTRDLDMIHRYYLIADKSGRQGIWRFSFEKELEKQFGDADSAIIEQTTFVDRSVTPASVNE